jgi:photosystem II stability/assembly factor-like uncharacterized protein
MTPSEYEIVYLAPGLADSTGQHLSRLLYAASFANQFEGWVVGAGQVLHTTDSGRTWSNEFQQGFLGYPSPKRIVALGNEACWAISPGLGSEAGRCFSRLQGGRWKAINLGEGAFPTDLSFVEFGRGWIVSGHPGLRRPPELFVTNDAGSTWDRWSLPFSGVPRKILFRNQKQGWLLEERTGAESLVPADERITLLAGFEEVAIPSASHTLLHSTNDGGKTWNRVGAFAGELHFLALDKSSLWVAGEGGFVAQSYDRGNTWQNCIIDSPRSFHCFALAGPEWVAVGGDGATLATTSDRGQHWVLWEVDKRLGGIIGLNYARSNGHLTVVGMGGICVVPRSQFNRFQGAPR